MEARAASDSFLPSETGTMPHGMIRRPPPPRSECSTIAPSSAVSAYRDARSAVSVATGNSNSGPGTPMAGGGHAPRKAPPKSPPAKPQASLSVHAPTPPSLYYGHRNSASTRDPSTGETPAGDVIRIDRDKVRIRVSGLLHNAGRMHLEEAGIELDDKGYAVVPDSMLCKGAHAANVSAINCDMLHFEGRLTPSLTVFVPFNRILDTPEDVWSARHDHMEYGKVWPICVVKHRSRDERDACRDGLHIGPATGAVGRGAPTVAVLVPTQFIEDNAGLKGIRQNPANYPNLCNSAPCNYGPMCTWTHLKPEATQPIALPKAAAGAPGGGAVGAPPPLPFGSNTQRNLSRLKGALQRSAAAKPQPVADAARLPDGDQVWSAAQRDVKEFFAVLAAGEKSGGAPVTAPKPVTHGTPAAPLRSMLLAWDMHHTCGGDSDDGSANDDGEERVPALIKADIDFHAPSLFGGPDAVGLKSTAPFQFTLPDSAQLHLCAPTEEQLVQLGRDIASAFPIAGATCIRICADPPKQPTPPADDETVFCTIRAQLSIPNPSTASHPWQCTLHLCLQPRP